VKEFRWNDWNLEHATRHGCTVEEIEMVVNHPDRGFPAITAVRNGWFKAAASAGE
jgi:hypothetical protein